MNKKAIILHGRYGKPEHHWFPYVERELKNIGLEVINIELPLCDKNRALIRLKFIETIGTNRNTILIGHSSGGVMAMRYAENHQLLGSVLVAACQSHFEDEELIKSGYFNSPWDWSKIKNNQRWIVQYASTDDPHIPISDARIIRDALNTDYYEYNNQGHFGYSARKFEFPEIVEEITKRLE